MRFIVTRQQPHQQPPVHLAEHIYMMSLQAVRSYWDGNLDSPNAKLRARQLHNVLSNLLQQYRWEQPMYEKLLTAHDRLLSVIYANEVHQ